MRSVVPRKENLSHNHQSFDCVIIKRRARLEPHLHISVSSGRRRISKVFCWFWSCLCVWGSGITPNASGVIEPVFVVLKWRRDLWAKLETYSLFNQILDLFLARYIPLVFDLEICRDFSWRGFNHWHVPFPVEYCTATPHKKRISSTVTTPEAPHFPTLSSVLKTRRLLDPFQMNYSIIWWHAHKARVVCFNHFRFCPEKKQRTKGGINGILHEALRSQHIVPLKIFFLRINTRPEI